MNDKIKGLIFGQALGDAVGAYTEFRTKRMIKKDYPTLEDFTFPPRDYRISFMKRDTKCDWTDDTDQLILLMECLTEEGRINEHTFARKLVYWVENGFPELGDKRGEGCGGHTFRVLGDVNFLANPIETAKKYTTQANGSLMRTSIIACMNSDIPTILKNTEIASQTTHFHYHCVESCFELVKILYAILKDYDLDVRDEKLEELDGNHIEHVLKTINVVRWAYNRRFEPFEKIIKTIALEGGDSDTNCAVAGAILGASIGYSQLPEHWLKKLPHRAWLMNKIEKFIDSL